MHQRMPSRLARTMTGRRNRALSLVLLIATSAACGDNLKASDALSDAALIDAKPVDPNAFVWDMVPEGVPRPFVPEDNPMTYTKVELGRYLFYDKQLSGNGTQSCASCHEQSKAFADGVALPTGSTGEVVGRNSLGLVNVAYHTTFTWMNPEFHDLRTQIAVPLFGEFPVELGISGLDEVVLARFF